MENISLILKNLEDAKNTLEVFGVLEGDKDTQLRTLKRVYRVLAKSVHPDFFPKDKVLADKAFKSLTNWYSLALSQIRNGAYGEEKLVTISYRKFTYVLSRKIQEGDLADIYLCNEGKNPKNYVLKLGKDSSVNHLLKNEAKNLIKISNFDGKQKKARESHIVKFYNSFEANSLQCNVLEKLDDFYSLEEIVSYFGKLDPRTMAWIFRRLFAALIGVHEAGVIHGAILPCHLMISPKDHNGKLIDFSYSVNKNEQIKNIVPKYKKFYPPEVFDKKGVGENTDIFMAANCMIYALGGDIENKSFPLAVPKKIQNFLKSLTIMNINFRENDSLFVYKDFDEMITELWGPKKWVELEYPKKA